MEEAKSMTIVLCSKGYPGQYKKNKIIENLNSLNLKKMNLFSPGTKLINNNIFSNGGRVLNVSSIGKF